MNIREFDITAQMIGGIDVSVSLRTGPMCPRNQEAYSKHVIPHTCSSCDCVERGYSSITSGGKSVTGCIERMRTRLKFEGMATYKGNDSIIAGSPKRSNMPQLAHLPSVDPRRNGQDSSCSSSSDLLGSDDPISIPSLAKHLKVPQPKDLFRKRRSPATELTKKKNAFGSISSEEG